MRDAGRSKMGYYPTPIRMTDKIVNHVHFDGPCNLFDPCAGTGEALARIAEGAKEGTTYGIELDSERAERATEYLDHVLNCGYEVARVTDSSMQLMLLNPPYDGQAGLGGAAMRKELIFLRHLSKKLSPDGILVYIIPQYTLSNEMASVLVQRFSDLAIYRFDDEDYQSYKQVVIFGRKRKSNVTFSEKLTEEEKQFRNELVAYGKDLDLEMKYLDDDIEQWIVPSSEDIEPPLFRGYILDEDELVQDIRSSDAFGIATNMLQNSISETKLSNPLMPLKVTHLATIISSGALNGAIGCGENRHLVVGMSRKKVDVQKAIDDNGNETVIESESYITVIRTLEQSGVIRDLQ